MPAKIKETKTPEEDLSKLLARLHREGAKDPVTLEELSYFKEFHPIAFKDFEEEIISALGLFFKLDKPDSLYSFLMSGFGEQDRKEDGSVLTPVQASIRRAIDKHQYTSISAPTSAGKSYSVRDFISEGTGDAVIIVPSRALIAEYIGAMRRKFGTDKNIMVSAFVDLVYTSRDLRRIFVLTPERSRELYALKDRLKVETFFFDEAQISEEGTRGIVFDATVRRIQKNFPLARLIFAHPFVENPEAQFSKHRITGEAMYANSYSHGAVGKICIRNHTNGNYYYFSPYCEKGHLLKNAVQFDGSFRDFALKGGHSILVYIAKSAIYRGKYTNDFQEYIEKLEPIRNESALKIIKQIEHILGADNPEHKSTLINLMRKGVVIHHGSIPLEVRFLIEDFIREDFASICFATSTLAQGINMPFDIVWLDNNRMIGEDAESKALGFKNLIGRSGRLTKKAVFDYGYVYTNNPGLLTDRIRTDYQLNEVSILDRPSEDDQNSDDLELIEAIRNDRFDDDKNLPILRVERLSKPEVLESARNFLEIIYRVPDDISESIGGVANAKYRERARRLLLAIYEASINRELHPGERNVFTNAMMIFFLTAQGKSFREIAGMRYSNITGRDEKSSVALFSQPANRLPDSSLLKAYSIYPVETPVKQVSYDTVVFDTYDYLDEVISFSLADTFIAAFEIYRDHFPDERADKIVELFRYGTNDSKHIMLLRYGFAPELVADISPHVTQIDEKKIAFGSSIASASELVRKAVEWYLPSNNQE